MMADWPRGPMDKASDYESGDSRFESWRGREFFFFFQKKVKQTFLSRQSGNQEQARTVADRFA